MSVRHTSGQSYDYAVASPATSVGITPTQAIVAGHTLAIGCRSDNAASGTQPDNGSVSDNLGAGNTYTKLRTHAFVDEHRCYLFECVLAGGGSATITFSAAGDGSARRTIGCSEYEADAGLIFHSSNSATGASTSADSGSVSLPQEALFFGWINDGFDGSPYTPGSGWNERADSGSANGRGWWADYISAGGETRSANATLSVSNNWTAMVGAWVEAVTPIPKQRTRRQHPVSSQFHAEDEGPFNELDVRNWF